MNRSITYQYNREFIHSQIMLLLAYQRLRRKHELTHSHVFDSIALRYREWDLIRNIRRESNTPPLSMRH